MVLELNTSVDCYGVHFHVRSYVCLFKRLLRTVIVHDRKIVTDVDHPYEDGAEMERQLAEQHWRLVSELRAGHLQLQATRNDETANRLFGWVGLFVNVWRAAIDCLPAVQWHLAVPIRSKRVTVLAWLFATSSWAAAGLSVQTELGLSDPGAGQVQFARASPSLDVCVSELPAAQVCEENTPLTDVRMAPRPSTAPRKPAAPAPPKVKSVPLVRPKPLPRPQQPRVRAVEPPADPQPIRIETLEPMPAPPVSNARPPVETLPGQLIDLTDVDVKPRPRRRQLPTYTRRAIKKKQQGRVGLKLLVDERGKIVDLRLLRTIPDSDLNEAAIEAAWRWRFEPASKDGVPVRVWKPVTVVFSTSFGEQRVYLLE
jgi:protein TonB